MADRIIRDELFRSIRWLDLPTDTHRLVFVGLVSIADDYGNVEGGPRRLYRWMHGFTQIKCDADSIKIMSELQDADLARRYEVDGREYWHIPRFKNSRRYWSRKCPQSPYPEQSVTPTNQQDAKNTSADLPQTCANPSRGVGVGVGEKQTLAPYGAFEQRFWPAYPKKKSRGAAEKAWKRIPAGNIDAIMAGLDRAIRSPEWLNERGKYIPHPASWLNAKGWLDETQDQTQPAKKQWVV